MKFVVDKPLPDNMGAWTEEEVRAKDHLEQMSLDQGQIICPLERMIHEALTDAGLEFDHTTATPGLPYPHLDFALPDDIYIEVKMFHSPRITAQMERVSDVIVVQGKKAGEFMARAIRALGKVEQA